MLWMRDLHCQTAQSCRDAWPVKSEEPFEAGRMPAPPMLKPFLVFECGEDEADCIVDVVY